MTTTRAYGLDRLIYRERAIPTGAVSEWGHRVTLPLTSGPYWARRMPLGVRDRFTAGANPVAFRPARFILRGGAGAADWVESDVLIDGGDRYRITGVAELGRGEWLELLGEIIR